MLKLTYQKHIKVSIVDKSNARLIQPIEVEISGEKEFKHFSKVFQELDELSYEDYRKFLALYNTHDELEVDDCLEVYDCFDYFEGTLDEFLTSFAYKELERMGMPTLCVDMNAYKNWLVLNDDVCCTCAESKSMGLVVYRTTF